MTPSEDLRCPHCDARPNQHEITDGWCDSCGKQLPSWISAKGSRRTSALVSSEPAPTSPRFFLWAVGACTVGGLVAAAAALAGAG